jgi:hypothetical protein
MSKSSFKQRYVQLVEWLGTKKGKNSSEIEKKSRLNTYKERK